MWCSSPRGFAGGDSGEWTARRGDRASSWRSSYPAQVQASMAHVQPSGCFLQACSDCGSQLGGPFLCGDKSSQFHKGACAFTAVLGDRSAGKAGPAACGKATPSPPTWTVKTLPRSALCLQAVSMDPEMFQSEELRGWVESRDTGPRPHNRAAQWNRNRSRWAGSAPPHGSQGPPSTEKSRP